MCIRHCARELKRRQRLLDCKGHFYVKASHWVGSYGCVLKIEIDSSDTKPSVDCPFGYPELMFGEDRREGNCDVIILGGKGSGYASCNAGPVAEYNPANPPCPGTD